ncbi:hypothetical protein [Thiolapillus sp.]
MAKGGRFPLLYWTSILMLALMLVFTGWYFYQNRDAVCRNSISDDLARTQLQRYWQKGRIIALMSSADDGKPVAAGLARVLPEDYDLLVADADVEDVFGRPPQILPGLKSCDASLLERISRLGQGNKLLLLPGGCLDNLAGGGRKPGLVLFLLKGEGGQMPKMLACARPGDWPGG